MNAHHSLQDRIPNFARVTDWDAVDAVDLRPSPGIRDRTSITKAYGERKPLPITTRSATSSTTSRNPPTSSGSGRWPGMSDDDPLTDRGETLADGTADPADAAHSSGESGPPADHPNGGASDDESDRNPVELGGEADERDPISDAAFSYDDADQLDAVAERFERTPENALGKS